MGSAVNLTGLRFGHLTVIEDSGERQHGSIIWLCRCDCGNTTKANSAVLRRGDKKSCGCVRSKGNLRHGMCHSRIYRIWRNMIRRCEDNNSASYKLYGAKGISVCNEWHDFNQFYKWAVENGYRNDLTIDRIDNCKDYCPSNCKWSDLYEQANNRSCCIYYEIGGKALTLSRWCREFGIPYQCAYNRIHKLGWEPERALTTPVDKSKRNKKAGENHG